MCYGIIWPQVLKCCQKTFHVRKGREALTKSKSLVIIIIQYFQQNWLDFNLLLNLVLLGIGRFAPIFNFICKQFLFENIIKKIRRFKKNRGFTKFSKIKFCLRQIFENSIIQKLSLGSCEVPQKCGPGRLSRFDIYWIQKDNQSKYIIDSCFLKLLNSQERWQFLNS